VLAWQPGAYLAAGFSVAIPWLVLSFFVTTEVAAYPAFLWAALAIQQSVAAPALRHDLFAVLAIGIAFAARTQFFALALVLPAAILLHEVGYRLAVGGPNRRAAVRDGVRTAYDGHRVLAIVCGVAAFVAIPLVLFGNPGVLLGPYAITATEGSLVPAGIWQSATAHLAAVAIATGALPFILAAQWALISLVRPTNKRSHAFGVLLLLVVILLTFQVASFAVRFGDGLVRDRYLFYVAPLLFIGMLASLRDGRGRWVGVLCGVAMFTLLAQWADLAPIDPWESSAFDRPASVLNGLLTDRGTELRLGARGLVAVIGLALGLIVALARAKVPRAPLSYAVAAAVLLFCALETRHAFERLERGHSPSGRLLAGTSANELDWIDQALPAGERASLVPYPLAQTWGPSAIAWWDAEFWNKTVRTAFDVAGNSFSYTPQSFPRRSLKLDFENGRIETNDEPAYLVLGANDVRLRPRGSVIARREPFVLLRAERPYTAAWATRGLTLDGWTRHNRPATLRLFARPRATSALHRVTMTLSAVGAVEFRTFRLRSGSAETSGRLVPGAAATGELDVCVPAHGFVDVLIEASPAGLVPGLPIAHGAELTRRPAGLQLLGISTVQRGRCSAPR
jgi:hypothetical protein